MVSNSGGAFLRPQTATRIGWNIGPALIPIPRRPRAERLPATGDRRGHPPAAGQQLARSARTLQAPAPHRLSAESARRIIWRKLVGEKEVGHRQHVAQQADALANQRRDLRAAVSRRAASATRPSAHHGQQPLGQLLDRQGADVLGVEPDGFGIEGILLA